MRNGSKTVNQRLRQEGINLKRDSQGHAGFPIIEQMILKVRTSSLERKVAIRRSHIRKTLRAGESGKQDERNNTQERSKNEPRAAEKRRKSTEKHVGDA